MVPQYPFVRRQYVEIESALEQEYRLAREQDALQVEINHPHSSLPRPRMASSPASPQNHLQRLPPELLEIVLLQLDITTLLLSQRVSQNWAHCIRNSRPIQQALFLAPTPVGDANNNKSNDHGVVANPLLVQHFPFWFPKRHTQYEAKCVGPSRLDSFLAARKHTHLRSDASWRRMLVVQPAVYSLAWVDRHHGALATELCHWVFHLSGGLRMDTLYDLVVSEQRNESFYFRVCWSWNKLVFRTSPNSPLRDNTDWERSLSQAVEQSGVVLDTWDARKVDHGRTWNSVVDKYQLPVTESNRDRLMACGSLEKHSWVDPAEMTGCATGGLLPDEVEIDL